MNIKDIVGLSDGNRYIITSIASFEGSTYIFLVDINKHDNIKFCQIVANGDKARLLEVTDDNLLIKLIPILNQNVQKEDTE